MSSQYPIVPPTPLLDLADTIYRNSLTVTRHLLRQNAPPPTFDLPEHVDNVPVHNAGQPQEIIDANAEIIEAASKLSALISGPLNYLKTLSYSFHDMTALSIVLEFGIASSIPLDESISFECISFESLADIVGLNARRLERVLRLLFTKHIFHEPRPGFVAHTAFSAPLASNKELAAFLTHCSHEAFPAASKLAAALRLYPDTEEPTETGFNLALQTEDPLFTFLSKDQARFDRFNLGMKGISQAGGRSGKQVVEGFPWGSLGKATVVDVGGGNGHISVALANAYPNLSLIVQDLPQAITVGEVELVPELASRVKFQAHDMFERQPIEGADVYYLRHILHDWPDDYAVQILSNLVPALKPGARVLVSDSVIPEPGILNPGDERAVRYLDFQMWCLHNARERPEKDFEELFQKADRRLTLQKVWRKGESLAASTIVEAVFLCELEKE